MPTIIFDFDSTIISCESLEMLIEQKLKSYPALSQEVDAITEAGIRGQIPFSESLRKRLEIAAPSLQEVIAFGNVAEKWLTPGIQELFQALHKKKASIWIMSGAPKELILPLGKKLGIAEEQIHAIQLLWDSDGCFAGIDPNDPFSISKAEGVKSLKVNWDSPTIGVGDGASDYKLLQQNLLEHFILFTKYIRCEELLKEGVREAHHVTELEQQLMEIINCHACS